MKKYDLIVLGAGSGGVRAARLAARQGLKVLIVEGRHWGGTCVNLGCVPKKFLVYAGDYARALAGSRAYGFPANPDNKLNWQELVGKLAKETGRLQGIYKRILKDNGVELLSGIGYFTGSNSIRVRTDAGDGSDKANQYATDGRGLNAAGDAAAATDSRDSVDNNRGKAGNGEREFAAARILIATGSKPFRPEIPGAELGLVSDDVFSLPQLPQSLCIVGGGYIALEFANIFAALGSKVTLLHRSARFLREFDAEAVDFALAEMRQQPNLTIMSQAQVVSIEKVAEKTAARMTEEPAQKSGARIPAAAEEAATSAAGESTAGARADAQAKRLKVNFRYGGKNRRLEAEQLVFAVGRTPNTAQLQLEKLGKNITGAKGEIKVDEFYQTDEPGIYALGDVVGRLALTPVAIAEAKKLIAKHFSCNDNDGGSKTTNLGGGKNRGANAGDAKNAGNLAGGGNSNAGNGGTGGGEERPLDYGAIPMAVFARPELARVGMSEEQATAALDKIKVYKTSFTPMSEAFKDKKRKFFIKLICDNDNRILGVHLVGEGAAEMIQGFALACKYKMTKSMLDETVGVHPTIAEEIFTLS